MVNAAFFSHHMQIYQNSVGRAINSAKSCEGGIIAITATSWTLIGLLGDLTQSTG